MRVICLGRIIQSSFTDFERILLYLQDTMKHEEPFLSYWNGFFAYKYNLCFEKIYLMDHKFSYIQFNVSGEKL